MSNSSFTTTNWSPEPRGRGTIGLLVSCFTTLLLCVYTVLHLNVPRRDISGMNSLLWSKVGLAMLYLIVPELQFLAAFSQRYSAWKLTRDVQKVLKAREAENGTNSRKHTWTTTHSFYAGMGGFALDATGSPIDFPYDRTSNICLTANGILILAELGHLPDISELSILDRSKADPVAKIIAAIQVSWLLLQCLARVVNGLPISPLEIYAVAHVLFTLMSYAMWFQKPLDICEPIVLQGEWIPPLCAIMYMFSAVSMRNRSGAHEDYSLPEIEMLVHCEVDATNVIEEQDNFADRPIPHPEIEVLV
ncbi:hypothetical protein BGZ57DRAFT_834350 [Hyaloscypha finlandica]|nr:hypothetical protein BGZ57DRAFT_834350 [Hyaloscypha finlandica]